AVASLIPLRREDVSNVEDSCPICLLSFKSILEGRVSGLAGESSTALTKIEACGHVFCVDDLSEWIRGRHGTCPACRYPFLPELRPLDSDDESSDGGEYIPGEHDIDVETDYETDFEDGLDYDTMDTEGDVLPNLGDEQLSPRVAAYVRRMRSAMALDVDEEWMDGTSADDEEHWSLTDDESTSPSEGEVSPGEHHFGMDPNIQVRLNSEGQYAIDE
ncbi:hypothetical protein K488DRAFT_35066, partial [Vararia minispora EC-137]